MFLSTETKEKVEAGIACNLFTTSTLLANSSSTVTKILTYQVNNMLRALKPLKNPKEFVQGVKEQEEGRDCPTCHKRSAEGVKK